MAVISSRPRTTDRPTWLTRHEEVGLTQAWRGQRSYDRPNTGKVGKVDIPQLQARASPQGPRTTCAHGPEPAVLAQQTRRQTTSTGQAQEFFPYHFGTRRRAPSRATSVN
ncbi:hypothetical protein BHE74_00049298 [Ensete ventricosum]|nr:hypothetical protein BHE74_00049298 [Ensete ventricosum]